MANEVSEYIAGLPEPERSRIAEIYEGARALVPEAVEGLSYGMPSLLYRGKGLLSVMSTQKHIGVYPHGNLGDLTDDVAAAGLGVTKGSIHLRTGERLPDELLERFVRRRVAQIDGT